MTSHILIEIAVAADAAIEVLPEDIDKVTMITKSGIEIPVQNFTVIQGGYSYLMTPDHAFRWPGFVYGPAILLCMPAR